MTKKYDLLVYVGRFQPFHIGHQAVIEEGLKQAREVLVLIGSANEPRSIRNPFTYAERKGMITQTFIGQDVFVRPIEDHTYNDEAWVRDVQAEATKICSTMTACQNRIGLIGCDKDHTSYYLKMFPRWDSVNIEPVVHPMVGDYVISSTDIREDFLSYPEGGVLPSSKNILPEATKTFLKDFSLTPDFIALHKEFEYVQDYKRQWERAPYAPTFVTVDAVVVQSGHILLVKRRAYPGKGLLALPGGFLNQTETLIDGCLRELREETRLKVPAPVLKGSVVDQKVFDNPNRSSRGRTITHAFYIELAPDEKLPPVKGSDDAEKAMWVPLSEVTPDRMFEDHFHIIRRMVGV